MKVSMKHNANHIFQQLWFPAGWALALTVNASIVRQVYFLHKFPVFLEARVPGRHPRPPAPRAFSFTLPRPVPLWNSHGWSQSSEALWAFSYYDFVSAPTISYSFISLCLVIEMQVIIPLGSRDDLLHLYFPPPYIMRLKQQVSSSNVIKSGINLLHWRWLYYESSCFFLECTVTTTINKCIKMQFSGDLIFKRAFTNSINIYWVLWVPIVSNLIHSD